jgi:outer membrane protein TolC
LQHARDLLNFNKGRFRVGAATENDILQAEAAMASREAEVISVQDDVEDTTDQLKRLTNLMADDNAWSLQIAPTDTPDFKDVTVNLDESLKTALTNRPDYIGARIDLENKQIQVRLAKNQTLPTLDLEGTFSLNGLGGSYSDTLDELRSGDFRTWQIGVFLRFPIGDPTAKGELQKRRLENEQALTNFKSLEQRIVIEVREAVRQLKTNHKRIVATQSALELEERKLAAEQKKYELGLSTNYNVLQFQADLSEAQTRHLKAIIDYNKAQVILTETLGTTLLAHNIQLTE